MQAAFDKELAIFAHALADAAGDVARRHFRAPLTIVQKEDKSPVTDADREVESAMRALIEKRFPEHGIFGEEHGRSNEQSPYQWVLDPIDGTRSFIAGFPLFTTLISLVRNGTPVLGVIDQPVTCERWLGVAGEKTFYNGKPAAARQPSGLEQAMIATTSMDFFTPEEKTAFLALKARCRYATLTGDAYAYAMLATGRVDIVVDVQLKPYDFCALVPVIEGAGGVITDWEGRPMTLESRGHVVAAANKALHGAALAMLRAR